MIRTVPVDVLAEGTHDRSFDKWVDCNDHQRSLVSFIRLGRDGSDVRPFVCNFTPVVRPEEPIGVPFGGVWREMLNSDAVEYGGSGVGNAGAVTALQTAQHGRPCRLVVTVPPLAVLVFHAHGGPAS